MDVSLKSRRALVCGASKGIGRAVAMRLAELGAEVVALARSESELKDLVKDSPGVLSYWVQDLSDHASLKENLKRELERGDFAILINNAGGPKSGSLLEASLDDFSKAFSVHIGASHVLTQGLVAGMRRQKYGRIVNIISTSVKVPIVGLGVSNTIRGAMASWAKTLAHELGPFGITVNNVLPGYTATDRLQEIKMARAEKEKRSAEEIEKVWLEAIPARRFAEPSEIAEAVAFLTLPGSSYINGINLPVDGGRTGAL